MERNCQCEENSNDGKAGNGERVEITLEKKQAQGEPVNRKPCIVFVPRSVVERNVKHKPGIDHVKLPKTVTLEQVKTLVRELEQKDVCDMVDLAEVSWQESDAKELNTRAQELETVAECLPVDEEEGDVNMRDDDRRNESDDKNRYRWKMTSTTTD